MPIANQLIKVNVLHTDRAHRIRVMRDVWDGLALVAGRQSAY